MKIFYPASKGAKWAVKILTVIWLLTGCQGSSYHAPVVDLQQPPSLKISHHIVAKGETLYSIAWRYNLEYRELARANGIRKPFILRPGQRLSLDLSQSATIEANDTRWSDPVTTRSRSQPSSAQKNVKVLPQNAQLIWQWPVRGKVLTQFSGSSGLNKGIDIEGKKGEPVLAAESGIVVYAGSGLRGYGKLIIVKHSETFLSAYAHNDSLLANEGDAVKVGQKIAEIGSTGTDRNKLHFEIRLEGKPVDPLRYLPSQ